MTFSKSVTKGENSKRQKKESEENEETYRQLNKDIRNDMKGAKEKWIQE